MDVPRKPLAKSEGRKKLKASGLVIQWRGTTSLDDWVAFIVNGTRSKRLILADHTSERRVKAMLSRIEGVSKREIERLAKGEAAALTGRAGAAAARRGLLPLTGPLGLRGLRFGGRRPPDDGQAERHPSRRIREVIRQGRRRPPAQADPGPRRAGDRDARNERLHEGRLVAAPDQDAGVELLLARALLFRRLRRLESQLGDGPLSRRPHSELLRLARPRTRLLGPGQPSERHDAPDRHPRTHDQRHRLSPPS